MNKKIFTFSIEYDGLDNFGTIEFCAKTQSEAIELFKNWCMVDNHLTSPIPIINITVVYNESDAAEYGDRYGNPSEYKIA